MNNDEFILSEESLVQFVKQIDDMFLSKETRAIALMIQSYDKDENQTVLSIAAIEIVNYFISGKQSFAFFAPMTSQYFQSDKDMLNKLMEFIDGADIYTYNSELVRLILNRKLKANHMPLFKRNQYKSVDHLLSLKEKAVLDCYICEDNVYAEKSVPLNGELIKSAFKIAKLVCNQGRLSTQKDNNIKDNQCALNEYNSKQNKIKSSLIDFTNDFNNLKLGEKALYYP